MKRNKIFKTAIFISLLANGALFNVNAQVTIGDNKAPETFSALELISNETRGLRLPQMTTQQRIDMEATEEFQANKSTEAMGLQIFNTSKLCVETWNGVKWIEQCAPEPDYLEINGVKWATRNVDKPGTFVEKPTDYGMFYQWGKNVGWSSTGAAPIGYESDGSGGWNEITTWPDFPDVSRNDMLEWEAAKDPCPNGWRIPVASEMQGLIDVLLALPSEQFIQAGEEMHWNFRFFMGETPFYLPAKGFRFPENGVLTFGTEAFAANLDNIMELIMMNGVELYMYVPDDESECPRWASYQCASAVTPTAANNYGFQGNWTFIIGSENCSAFAGNNYYFGEGGHTRDCTGHIRCVKGDKGDYPE